MNTLFVTLMFLTLSPQPSSVGPVEEITRHYGSLIQAENKGDLSGVMRHRRNLLKVVGDQDLSTLIPGEEHSLLRLGCQRVIGQDHQLNQRFPKAVEVLKTIIDENLAGEEPQRKIATRAILPLSQSYSELGQIEDALAVLDKGIPYLSPGSVEIREAWLLNGDLKAALGEVLPAKRAWSRLTDDLNNHGDEARARRNSAVRLALLGKKAPSLGSTTWFGGKKQSLQSMKGKVILLDFWATWCGPCRMLMPGLDEIQKHWADKGLQVLGVTKPYAQGWLPEKDNKQRGQTVRGMTRDAFLQHLLEFRRRFGVEYPYVVTGKQGFDSYRVGGIPMVVLIDKKGDIAWVRVGAGGEGLLEATIERLLKKE